MVFFHHANQADFPFWLFRVLNELHIGVTVFFVLSGFLITLRYFHSFEITATWFKKYIKNRIARIYPMYFILTLFTFFVAWYTNDVAAYNGYSEHISIICMNVFFLRGFFDNLKFTGISQGWSLTVEECFYFLAPLIFLQVKKHVHNFIVVPLLLVTIGLLFVHFLPHSDAYQFMGSYRMMFLYTIFGRIMEFMIGILVAIKVLQTNQQVQHKKINFTFLGLLIALCSLAILCLMPISSTQPFGLYHPLGMFTNNVLLPIGIGVFFYGLMNEETKVKNILSTPLMDVLGKSSYIFYLIHIGVFAHFFNGVAIQWVDAGYEWLYNHEYDFIPEHIHASVFVIFPVFVALNLVSYVLYRFIEEPLNLYIRKSSFLTGKQISTR